MMYIIDGDFLLWRCGKVTDNEPVENCLHLIKGMLNSFLKEGDEYKLFLGSSDKSNFRYTLAKTREYKANRKDDKPKHFEASIKYLVDVWGAEMVHGQEADDAAAIAYCESAVERDTTLVSTDKDLKTVPGTHYNPVTKELIYIDEFVAMKNFYTQVLVGDSSDNVPGCKGIGKIKARKLLEHCSTNREMYDACLEAYQGDEELMHEMCNLLWIRRKENDKFKVPTEEAEWLSNENQQDELTQYENDDFEEYE